MRAKLMKSKFVRIYLDKNCKDGAYCNRNKYFEKYAEYEKDGTFKKMSVGSPKVICIDGIYYYIDKLKTTFQSKFVFDRYISELNSPTIGMKQVVFIWR